MALASLGLGGASAGGTALMPIHPASGSSPPLPMPGPTLSSKHSTLESKMAAQPHSYHPPAPIVVVPSEVSDPVTFAGDRPRGVSQIIVVLLVSFALMMGFVLGFAVARSM